MQGAAQQARTVWRLLRTTASTPVSGYKLIGYRRMQTTYMDNILPQNGAKTASNSGSDLVTQDMKLKENQNRKMDILAHFASNAMIIICQVLISGLTVYVTYVSFKSYSLFSWHPACMVIGSVALMSAAISAVRRKNVLASALLRQQRVRAHWILQALVACFALAGFSVVVANKNLLGKPHFASVHGVLGLAHVVLAAAASCGGVATFFSARLRDFLRAPVIKLWHSVVGVVAFAVGVAATVTGLYTRFFRNAAGPTAQVVCTVLLVVAAVLTLESAVRSAYARFRLLYRK